MAAGSIGGAALGARATKKAAKQASNAQVGMARENNALAREFRADNTANFAPWMQSGGRANALIDSFLYGPQAAQPQQAAPAQQTQQYGQPTSLTTRYGLEGFAQRGGPSGWQDTLTSNLGDNWRKYGELGQIYDQLPNQGPTPNMGMQAQPGTVTTQAPMNGYETFVNSPYYQNPLNEGMRQINTGYAARGMLESGDAMKAINRFGQDYASGRQGEFLGLAGQQSDRGLQGAGAIAGVGMNALSSMSDNNQNAANAMSNAAIARGNATAGMWSGVGAGLGNLAGSLMAPSSYGNYAPGTYAGPINVTGYGGR